MKKSDFVWFFGAIAAIAVFMVIFFIWEASWQNASTPPRYEAEPTATPTPASDIVFIDGIPVYSPTDAPTEAPTPTETPTQAPTATNTPTQAPTPTNSPTPTQKPAERPGNAQAGTYKVEAGHAFKSYTAYTCYNLTNSPQYRLQKIAKTDEHGLRVVTDADGVERFCVAMGPAWAGGNSEHIGRCIDVVMKNGATLHCVLADMKKAKHTEGGAGLYGAGNHDLLEFIVDMAALVPAAARMGDCSFCGPEFVGDAAEVRVFDKFIPGFGK